jgi:hypothetical protein
MKPWVALACLAALATVHTAAAQDKTARDKAADDMFARDKTPEEKAADEKAAQERATRERAAQESAAHDHACLDAADQGQSLRNAQKLVEARDQFKLCAATECPAVVHGDCESWLDAVEKALPHVVPMAKDAAGNPVPTVKVSMDGKPVLDVADGRSIDADPGTHLFTFETADGRRGEKTAVVGQGEKDVRVIVVLDHGTASADSVPEAADFEAPPMVGPAPAAAATVAPQAPASTFPWKLTGLITGGVGVVVLDVSLVLGLHAISEKNEAGCASNGMCRDANAVSTQKDAQTAGNLSTGFFVAGAALAAAGAWMFLAAPGSSVQAAPTVGDGSAGVVVKGLW